MMAIAISHQDGQSSLLLMAFDLQLAIIVIFCHHAGHFNHDCWHHHNHDITQNLAEKFFHCDSGHDNSDGAIVISVVVAF